MDEETVNRDKSSQERPEGWIGGFAWGFLLGSLEQGLLIESSVEGCRKPHMESLMVLGWGVALSLGTSAGLLF